jgi:hypothetical protein
VQSEALAHLIETINSSLRNHDGKGAQRATTVVRQGGQRKRSVYNLGHLEAYPFGSVFPADVMRGRQSNRWRDGCPIRYRYGWVAKLRDCCPEAARPDMMPGWMAKRAEKAAESKGKQ